MMRLNYLIMFLCILIPITSCSSKTDKEEISTNQIKITNQELAKKEELSSREIMNKCIVEMIRTDAKSNYWINARELEKTCACIANNIALGLNTQTCEHSRPIKNKDIEDLFKM